MSKRTEIYVCELCGHVIEILEGADGGLVCCGQNMTLQKENSTDAAQEKHVPAVTINGTLAEVQIGSTAHPMESQHHITWIELHQGNKIQRCYLSSGTPPQAKFTVEPGIPVTVRAFCNLHGLWKN